MRDLPSHQVLGTCTLDTLKHVHVHRPSKNKHTLNIFVFSHVHVPAQSSSVAMSAANSQLRTFGRRTVKAHPDAQVRVSVRNRQAPNSMPHCLDNRSNAIARNARTFLHISHMLNRTNAPHARARLNMRQTFRLQSFNAHSHA